MVRCVYPIIVTSSITLDPMYDTYVVNPAANMIITIPLIPCVGKVFRLRRGGASFGITVLVQPSGSDQIKIDSTTNTINYPLNPLNYIEITYATEGFWYVKKLLMNDPNVSGGILTTNFVENSSKPYVTIDKSTGTIISYFYHRYSINGPPNYFAISVLYLAGTVSGVLQIYTGTVSGAIWTPLATPHMSIAISISSAGIYHFDTSTIVNAFPITDNLTQIRWTSVGGSNNQQAGLNSIYIF